MLHLSGAGDNAKNRPKMSKFLPVQRDAGGML